MNDRAEILPLARELSSPLSDRSPTGDDPRTSAEFEFAKSEIAKTSERDWKRIASAARSVLTTQAKDATLLCYHLLASTAANGWVEGAATAQATAILLRDHWDAIHPLRERARHNAFAWLSEERTLGTFAQVSQAASDHSSLQALLAALEEIQVVLQDKSPAPAPSIRALVQIVQEKEKSVRPAAPASAPTEASPPTTPPSAALQAPDSGPQVSKGDLLKSLQKIALQLSTCEPDVPTGYRLLRICRWQEMTLPKNEGGKTNFAPPHPARIAFLEGLVSQKAWGALLEKSESIFTEPGLHLWLDLQRWVVLAFQERGLEPCARAVRLELRGLLERAPGMADLKFGDGTPLASQETRQWLEDLLREETGALVRSSAAREDTLESDTRSARELAAAGRAVDGIELLEEGLVHGDLRSKTLRQLEIARTALTGGKIRTALSVSTEIADRAFRMDLGAWEPVLEREILETHLKALATAIDSGTGDRENLRSRREMVGARAAAANPALLARMEF